MRGKRAGFANLRHLAGKLSCSARPIPCCEGDAVANPPTFETEIEFRKMDEQTKEFCQTSRKRNRYNGHHSNFGRPQLIYPIQYHFEQMWPK